MADMNQRRAECVEATASKPQARAKPLKPEAEPDESGEPAATQAECAQVEQPAASDVNEDADPSTGNNPVDVAAKALDEVIGKLQSEQSVLRRALITLQGKEPYETVNSAATRGGDRRSEAARARDQTDTEAVRSYAEYVAERTGLDERTVMRDIQIAGGIAADVAKLIFARRLAISNETSPLVRLCKLRPAQQRRAVRAYGNEGKDAFDAFVTNLLSPSTAQTTSGTVGGGTGHESAPSGATGTGVLTTGNSTVQSGEDAAPTSNGTTTTPTNGETHVTSTSAAPAAASRGVPPHTDATETERGDQSTGQGGEPSEAPASGTADGAASPPPGNGSNGSTQPRPSPTAVRDREVLQILRGRAADCRRVGSLFPTIPHCVLDAELAQEDVRVRLGSRPGVRTLANLKRRARLNAQLHDLEQASANVRSGVAPTQAQLFLDLERAAASLRAQPGEIESSLLEHLQRRLVEARETAAAFRTPFEQAMDDVADDNSSGKGPA